MKVLSVLYFFRDNIFSLLSVNVFSVPVLSLLTQYHKYETPASRYLKEWHRTVNTSTICPLEER